MLKTCTCIDHECSYSYYIASNTQSIMIFNVPMIYVLSLYSFMRSKVKGVSVLLLAIFLS